MCPDSAIAVLWLSAFEIVPMFFSSYLRLQQFTPNKQFIIASFGFSAHLSNANTQLTFDCQSHRGTVFFYTIKINKLVYAAIGYIRFESDSLLERKALDELLN